MLTNHSPGYTRSERLRLLDGLFALLFPFHNLLHIESNPVPKSFNPRTALPHGGGSVETLNLGRAQPYCDDAARLDCFETEPLRLDQHGL